MLWKQALIATALVTMGAAAFPKTAPYALISGAIPLNGDGPDGNTIIFDAPRGLIVMDTGRHPEHSAAILALAMARGKPIAAIVNSHWHLDHTTGNMDLLAAYPRAAIVSSRAAQGRLFRAFMGPQREAGRKALAEGKVTGSRKAELERAQAFLDDPRFLSPTLPIDRTGAARLGGRRFIVHLARYAATEGDVWLEVPEEHMVAAGDLVVDIVPFMDTACPDGWRKALGEIARVDFHTLIPGHGQPMTKPQFLRWKRAYDRFVDCGRSTRPVATCAEGWTRDAAPFIDAAHRTYAREAAEYYLQTRLRSSPAEQRKYCPPA